MHRLLHFTCLALTLFAASGCRSTTGASDSDAKAAVHRAKQQYVDAINANDLDAFLPWNTEDIVYVPPNSPPVAGKSAVSEWAQGYFAAYHTQWTKTPEELVVRGDLAYEWYSYASRDTPRPDGPAAGTPIVTDTGNGIVIWRRGSDGVWRVSRDVWASDRAAGE